MKNHLFWIGALIVSALVFNGCKNGCVTCTGPTAPQKVCKDDYTETSDYQNYVNEYEAQGGVCEK